MDNQEEKIQEDTETEEENELQNQEEFTYNIDNNNINHDYSNRNDEKNSLIYIIVGFIILAVIIIGLIILVNKKDKKVSEYTQIESKLKEAAKKYYNKYQEQLPITEENYVTISSETLIENSYLKPFNEMIENASCTGYVNVFKNQHEYVYFPFLDCGSEYKSIKLNEKIIEENSVSNSDGLYKEKNEYVFKGEYPNNFIKFNNKIWRIIKINEDGSIKLILNEKKIDKAVWDDRFNSDKSGYVGKNDFRISRILDTLEDAYEKNKYVDDENKQLIVKHNWCIGKTSENNTPISSLNICTDTYELYIGLITIDEVLIPSLDENCKNMYDAQCTNYNYFFDITTGWTLNAISEKTQQVFYSSGATISPKTASTSSYIRPVININGNVLYKSGNGTSETPYIIEK